MNSLTPFQPKFFIPKYNNLTQPKAPNNLNNLKPGAAPGGASNALNPASYGQPPYWASDGASVNSNNMSDPQANNTMNVEDMTMQEQEQAMAITEGIATFAPAPISYAAAIANKAIERSYNQNANTPGVPGGSNPGPGSGGPAATSPAGGAQAAGGHAPGTGTPGAPGQGPGGSASTGASSGTGVSAAPGTASNFSGDPSQADNSTGGSGDGGSTVICTELHRQGLMPEDIWRADEAFALTVDPVVRAGYLVWGVPVVRLMRKSKTFTKFVRLFAKPWSEHMAYEMGATENDNTFGRVLMRVGVPLCRVIGEARRRGIVLAR